eukprot:TRINITY_DN80541_c0_g1_i1.p1 TRINITY_DN80541_c0_g1~~TRINITY_DN80541_c0_g1_i1.p1  ORF type:complete len:894 (-),score=141.66 TRINITY_DN80541_c0_g1_i1:174-2822(-)
MPKIASLKDGGVDNRESTSDWHEVPLNTELEVTGDFHLLQMEIVWKDQGWGYRKGQIRVELRRPAKQELSDMPSAGEKSSGEKSWFEEQLFGYAGHEFETRHKCITTIGGVEPKPGDRIIFQYHVGGGGGHQLHVTSFKVQCWDGSIDKLPLLQLCACAKITLQDLQTAFESITSESKGLAMQQQFGNRYPLNFLAENHASTPDILKEYLKHCTDPQTRVIEGSLLVQLCSKRDLKEHDFLSVVLEAENVKVPGCLSWKLDGVFEALRALCANVNITTEQLDVILRLCDLTLENPSDFLEDEFAESIERGCPSMTEEQVNSFVRESLGELLFNRGISGEQSKFLAVFGQHTNFHEFFFQAVQEYTESASHVPTATITTLVVALIDIDHEVVLGMLHKMLTRDGPAGAALLDILFEEHEVPFRMEAQAYLSGHPRTAISSESHLNTTRRITFRLKDVITPLLDVIAPLHLRARDAFLDQRSTITEIAYKSSRLKGICSYETVHALSSAPELDTLSCLAASAIVSHAWASLRWLHLVDMLLNLLNIALLMAASEDIFASARKIDPKYLFLLCILIVKDVSLEIVQYRTVMRSQTGAENTWRTWQKAMSFYLRDNLLDWFALVLEVLGLASISSSPELMRPWNRGVIAAWCAHSWLRVAYDLRPFEFFGPRFLPILNAVADTVPFFIINSFVVAAASHALYTLQTQEVSSHWGAKLYASLRSTFQLGLLGDFDLNALEGLDSYYELEGETMQAVDPPQSEDFVNVQIWFLLTSTSITLLMTNLLVGILSSNYERYEDMSKSLFVRARAHVITMQFNRLPKCLLWMVKNRDWAEGYLWMASRVTPVIHEERSSRAVFQQLLNPIKTTLEEMGAKLETRRIPSRDQA